MTESLSDLITECLRRDQFRLRRRLKHYQQSMRQSDSNDPKLQKLTADIEASVSRRAARLAGLPQPSFPANLPVSERRGEIREAIEKHQVVIVAGETGSGKTTQLPKICLELGRGVAGMIGHTQPRRLAARSIANRIAEELQTEVGATVGYKVRFKDQVGPKTYLKLMTDGILLAEIQGDRFLNDYDTLIIDEAHERSLNIDFLLGYLKHLLPKRPDLKVIITSATIDTERFSRHFDNAPVIEVSGRTYPVEVRYRPLLDDTSDNKNTGNENDTAPRDIQQAILEAVDELAAIDRAQGKSPGHILIFFSGEREIRDAAESLRKHHPPQTEILPLYARLSGAEQNRVFSPAKHRRIVLATNVAETSLTVPGIHYVIDTGTVRISRYSYRSKIQRLPIEPVSQSSANQRKGRCGRISEGVCIRLYSAEDFNNRPEFTEPEIKRTNLAAVILQMALLRLGHIDDFPFIEPPDARYIKDGYKLLHELGAVDARNTITALGKELSRLPVDPKIGRMLLAARQSACLQELLIIGSALSVQDPRERPADKQQQADEKHRLILRPPEAENAEQQARQKQAEQKSDFLFYLKLWHLFEEQRKHLSQNKLRKFCQQHFLSYNRMQEWRDIYQQIFTLFKEQGVKLNTTEAGDDDIHKVLLSGLLGNIGNKSVEGNEYFGARNIRFVIHPGSWQAKKPPRWIMCAELVETTRLYGRMVARIDPQWIEDLAAHLLKRSYSEPHWQKKPAQVSAYERTTLYGITVCPKRRINYGPIDPVLSREIFIREALVQGDIETRASFFKYNQSVIAEIESLEDKGRRRDILVDEQALFEFYDMRIPADIYNGKAFEKWLKTVQQSQPEILFLQKEALMRHEAEHINEAQFPGSMELNGVTLPLDYHFEPGHVEDGVTVVVPLAILGQLQATSFDYLVPGLLRDKVIALIKCLPKTLRKLFVPVPDYADSFLASGYDHNLPLIDSLTAYMQKFSGTSIDSDAWQRDNLPDFYAMNFRVVDPDNQVLGVGRDLTRLQQALADLSTAVLSELPTSDIEKQHVTQWDFGTLEEVVELQQHGLTIRLYPAIVDDRDDGESVSVRLFQDQTQARAHQHAGLRRLFRLIARHEMKYVRKNLRHLDKIQLYYTSIGNKQHLLQDLEDAIIDDALLAEVDDIRDEAMFNRLAADAKQKLVNVANQTCDLLYEILNQYHQVAKRLQGKIPLTWFDAVKDIRQQLGCLVYAGFFSATPRPWLQHLPRYLQAINLRLNKIERSLAADKQRQAEVQKHWNRVYQQLGDTPAQTLGPEWQTYRWMVEEMRVSLFAQELRTSLPVSSKKLEQQAARL